MPTIPYRYIYLIVTLLFLIPWALLYWHRKDLRKEMIAMGIIAALFSFAGAFFWTADWWRPETITGTRVGVEDILLGISNGGIAAVLYEEIFRRRLYKRDNKKHKKGAILIFIISPLFFLTAIFLGLTSFYASAMSLIFVSLILVYLRKDLLISSLINGLLMVLVVLPVYYFLIIFSTDFVEKTYFLDKLSGVTITRIPIEELIFYYLFAFMVTLYYEYWQGARLRKIPVKKP